MPFHHECDVCWSCGLLENFVGDELEIHRNARGSNAYPRYACNKTNECMYTRWNKYQLVRMATTLIIHANSAFEWKPVARWQGSASNSTSHSSILGILDRTSEIDRVGDVAELPKYITRARKSLLYKISTEINKLKREMERVWEVSIL